MLGLKLKKHILKQKIIYLKKIPSSGGMLCGIIMTVWCGGYGLAAIV